MFHRTLQCSGTHALDRNGSCLQVLALLGGVGGEADPLDLLLLLGDDVHGHEHVEGIVDSAADVLLVVHVLEGSNHAQRLRRAG